MKNRNLLITLWSSCIVISILIIGAYILNFGANGISNDPERWAQFGSYLGGFLNPFISIINLLILTYLSIRLVKNEDKRNEWTLMELARPYGEFCLFQDDGIIKIAIENIGLGPMIFKKISIKKSDDNYESSFAFLEGALNNLTYKLAIFECSNGRSSIGKDSTKDLLELEIKNYSVDKKESLNNFLKILNGCEIEITYFDMYNREVGKLSEKMSFSIE